MNQTHPIRPECNPNIARDSVPLAPIESTGPESARREGGEDEIDDDDAVAVEVEDHQIEAAVPPVPISDEDDPTKVRDAVVEKGARDPGQPSKAEREAHNLTHCPYRSWCEHCVRGQAIGRPHRKITGEAAIMEVPRVILDYAFLQQDMAKEREGDEHESEHAEIERSSMKILVMVETECDSIWAYTVENKGSMMEPWLAPRICEDLATVGLGKGRIIVKADQEPAIVDLQKEISRTRADAGTALDSSRVGDSDSNGKIERAIRKLKGIIRTIRSGLEAEVGERIDLESPIIPWLVRHAAYILSRSEVKEDGKTALQRMKGRKTTGVLTNFGETVLFKMPRTRVTIGDFEDRFSEGTWVGLAVRSGEHVVANAHGTFRTGAIMRKPADARWSAELLRNIRGSPKEPRPGSNSSKIPVFVKYDADGPRADKRFEPRPAAHADPRQMYIYKKDIEKHGPTGGCAACSSMEKRGHSRGYAHSSECRLRFEELVKESESGRRRLDRADTRLNDAVRLQEEPGVIREDAPMEAEGEQVPIESPPQAEGEQMQVSADSSAGSSNDHLTTGTTGTKRKASEHEEDGSKFVPRAAGPRGQKRKPEDDGVDAFDAFASKSEKWVPTAEAMRVTKVIAGSRTSAVIAESIRGGSPIGSNIAEKGAFKKTRCSRPILSEREKHGVFHSSDPGSTGFVQQNACSEVAISSFSRSSSFRLVGTDEVAGPPVEQDEHRGEEEGIPKPISSAGAIDTLKTHPGPIVKPEDIEKEDLSWRDIGSGTFAKTFKSASNLKTSTRGGPPMSDVHRRTVWSLKTGRVIDDCFPEDVADEILHRELAVPEDIRVELVMKDALCMYHRVGSDVSEVYSQPRIAQESSLRGYMGQRLQPGWSLDLTRLDPLTGLPWHLSCVRVQRRVLKMVEKDQPLFLIGSPPCTVFSNLQNLSRGKRDAAVVA